MQPPQSIEEIKAGLETTEKGGVRQSIRNCLTVFQRDPLLSGAIAYNILTDRKDIIKPIGFHRESTALNDTDMKYLLLYLEETYGLTNEKKIDNAIGIVANENKYHPIRDYLNNIILTSKYGKTKCATAKVVAGIITAILTTTLIAAFNLLLAFVFYGTEGLDCSILFAPSDYVEAFIPFNITCGTLLKYQILLAFTCTLSVTGITLFLSAISKNQIVALVAAMAIFLFPVLLPITEVNPLFRLVGLLPIYHVLAISLLSVEQMSNGMLYAIWAIPAALLFLGVGAGISRRVFAKHQVL